MNKFLLVVLFFFSFFIEETFAQYASRAEPFPYACPLAVCGGTTFRIKINNLQNFTNGTQIDAVISTDNFASRTSLPALKYSFVSGGSGAYVDGPLIYSGTQNEVYMDIKIPTTLATGTYKLRIAYPTNTNQDDFNCPGGTFVVSTPPTAPVLTAGENEYGNGNWIGHAYSWTDNNSQGSPYTTAARVGVQDFFNTANYLGYFTSLAPINFDDTYTTNGMPGTQGTNYQVTNICSRKTNFSIRYRRTNFTAGTYTFTVNADDGIRLSVDGGATWITNTNQWIEKAYDATSGGALWSDPSTTVSVCLSPSDKVVVEYFQRPAGTRSTLSHTFVPVAGPNLTAPAPVSKCENEAASFSVTETTGSALTNYQWQYSTDGGISFNNVPAAAPYSGITTNTLSITAVTAAMNNYQYRAMLGTAGACGASATSAAAALTVTSSSSVDAQPTDAAVCPGQDTSFTVKVTGTAAFQWQVKVPGGAFVNIPNSAPYSGVTSKTLKLTGVTANMNGNQYQVIVTGCVSTTTPFKTLTINSITPGSISSPAPVCYGATPAPFTSTAAPTGGSGTYTFQWQSSTDNTNFTDVSGAISDTYAPGPLTSTTYFLRNVSSGGCGPVATASSVVVVNVTPGEIGDIQTICYNTAPSQLKETVPPAGAATFNYQWQSSTNGVDFFDINGAIVKTYTPGSLTTITYFRRNITGTTCGILSSPSIAITVNPELAAGTIAAPQSICSGLAPDALTQTTAPTGGIGTYTYQWQSSSDDNNWTSESGANASTYSPGILTSDTYYRSGATSGTCGTVYSPSILISMKPNVVVSVSISNPNPFCVGDPVTFNATPVNGGATPAYEWRVNNIAVPGETGSSFTSTALVNGDVITTILTSGITTCVTGSPATSNAVTMVTSASITPSVSIGVSPNDTLCQGESATFSITGFTGQGTAPTFQWRFNGSNMPGETGLTYTPAALNNEDSVSVIMTSNSTCALVPTAHSNVIEMVVIPNVTPAITITVDKNPICAGENVAFTITGSLNGGSGPTYQWLLNGTDMPAETAFSLNSISLQNNDKITIRITSNEKCLTTPTALSNEITMTVNPVLPVSVTLTDPGQLCSGALASFTATPVNPGTAPVYEWRVGSVVQSATGTSFSSSSLTDNDIVTVILNSSETCQSNSPASANVVMDILPPSTPTVSINPAGTICVGENFEFTATPQDAGTATYQWYVNNIAMGTNSNKYSSVGFVDGDLVKVEVTSSLPCVTGPATSEIRVMDVISPSPASVTITGPDSICAGQVASFNAAPVFGGTSPTYQWKVNGVNEGTGGPSFSSSSLISPSSKVEVIMTSSISCVTNNPATSNPVTVQVKLVPDAAVTGVLNICAGDTTMLTTPMVTGAIYTWSFNGTAMGANSNQAEATQTGVYLVTVTNKGCQDTSEVYLNVSQLTVDAGPDVIICKGEFTTLTATPTTTSTVPVAFQWVPTGLLKAGISVSPGKNTLYTVTASDGVCATSDTVRVNLRDEIIPTLYIPNSFTPDGDELNDVFQAKGDGIIEFHGAIFNRWGELIYEWDNINDGWDGSLKENKIISLNDVYIYSIKVKNECKNSFEDPRSGIVTVIK